MHCCRWHTQEFLCAMCLKPQLTVGGVYKASSVHAAQPEAACLVINLTPMACQLAIWHVLLLQKQALVRKSRILAANAAKVASPMKTNPSSPPPPFPNSASLPQPSRALDRHLTRATGSHCFDSPALSAAEANTFSCSSADVYLAQNTLCVWLPQSRVQLPSHQESVSSHHSEQLSDPPPTPAAGMGRIWSQMSGGACSSGGTRPTRAIQCQASTQGTSTLCWRSREPRASIHTSACSTSTTSTTQPTSCACAYTAANHCPNWRSLLRQSSPQSPAAALKPPATQVGASVGHALIRCCFACTRRLCSSVRHFGTSITGNMGHLDSCYGPKEIILDLTIWR